MKLLLTFLFLAVVALSPSECFAYSWYQSKCAAQEACSSGDYVGATQIWRAALRKLLGRDDPRWCETVSELAKLHALQDQEEYSNRMYEDLVEHVKATNRMTPECQEALVKYRDRLKNSRNLEREKAVTKVIINCPQEKTSNVDTIAFSTANVYEGENLATAKSKYATRGASDDTRYGGLSHSGLSSSGGGHGNSEYVNVKGYYRDDGTYVHPHKRSAPNDTEEDNWSKRGSVSPFTGQRGYRSDSSFGRSTFGSPTSHQILQSYSNSDTPSSTQAMQSLPRMSSSPFYK